MYTLDPSQGEQTWLDYDLHVTPGTDYRRVVPVVGLSDGQTLADWSAAGRIMGEHPPGTVLHELDLALSDTEVILTIPRDVSAEWDWSSGYYLVNLTAPDGTVEPFLKGLAVVDDRAGQSGRIITRQMLRDYMSSPEWTAAQEVEADRVVRAVEADLSAALYGAPITPVPRNEVVTVTREGMVASSLPIARLISVNGLAIITDPDTGLPTNLPTGYSLRDHYLWQNLAVGDTSAWAFGVPWFDSARRVDLDRGFGGGPYYTGYSVALAYEGGWGAEPALVAAILRKAAVRMSGQHSDTMVTSGLNAAAPDTTAGRESPNFTDDDMKSLGRFRSLGWGG